MRGMSGSNDALTKVEIRPHGSYPRGNTVAVFLTRTAGILPSELRRHGLTSEDVETAAGILAHRPEWTVDAKIEWNRSRGDKAAVAAYVLHRAGIERRPAIEMSYQP